MKKIVAVLSSLLVIAGVKAQTPIGPVVKRETIKPAVVKPVADSLTIKPGISERSKKTIKVHATKTIMPVKVKVMEPVAKPIKV
ncbi:MAG: hypothetical protein ABI091_06465 [Ferruginibacter sp.]